MHCHGLWLLLDNPFMQAFRTQNTIAPVFHQKKNKLQKWLTGPTSSCPQRCLLGLAASCTMPNRDLGCHGPTLRHSSVCPRLGAPSSCPLFPPGQAEPQGVSPTLQCQEQSQGRCGKGMFQQSLERRLGDRKGHRCEGLGPHVGSQTSERRLGLEGRAKRAGLCSLSQGS